MRITKVTTTPNTEVVFDICPVELCNCKCYNLAFCLNCEQEKEFNKCVGNEQVFLKIGADKIPMYTNAGNCFYSGRLYVEKVLRLVYGSNGYPSKVKHFECLNTPKCSWFNPGNDCVEEIVTP